MCEKLQIRLQKQNYFQGKELKQRKSMQPIQRYSFKQNRFKTLSSQRLTARVRIKILTKNRNSGLRLELHQAESRFDLFSVVKKVSLRLQLPVLG